jgi:hypothetical protein
MRRDMSILREIIRNTLSEKMKDMNDVELKELVLRLELDVMMWMDGKSRISIDR